MWQESERLKGLASNHQAAKGIKSLMSLVLLVFLTLGSAGNAMAASGDKSGNCENRQYFEMKSMVVNISNVGENNRFLKVKPVVVTYDERCVKDLRKLSPIIQSKLLSLYSREDTKSLLADDGFDNLREKSLEVVQEIVTENKGFSAISDVLFNEFMIQ